MQYSISITVPDTIVQALAANYGVATPDEVSAIIIANITNVAKEYATNMACQQARNAVDEQFAQTSIQISITPVETPVTE